MYYDSDIKMHCSSRYSKYTLFVYVFFLLNNGFPLSDASVTQPSTNSVFTETPSNGTFEGSQVIIDGISILPSNRSASKSVQQENSAVKKYITLILALIIAICIGVGAHFVYKRHLAEAEKLRLRKLREEQLHKLKIEIEEKTRLELEEQTRLKAIKDFEDLIRQKQLEAELAKKQRLEEERKKREKELLDIAQLHNYMDELKQELKLWYEKLHPDVTEAQFDQEMLDGVQPFLQSQHQDLFAKGDEGLSPEDALLVKSFRERVWKAYDHIMQPPYNQRMIESAKRCLIRDGVKPEGEDEDVNTFISQRTRILFPILNKILVLRDSFSAVEKYKIAVKPGAEVLEYLQRHPEEAAKSSRRVRPKMVESVTQDGKSSIVGPVKNKEEFMELVGSMSALRKELVREYVMFRRMIHHPVDTSNDERNIREEDETNNLERILEFLDIEDDKFEQHRAKYDEYIKELANNFSVFLYDSCHTEFKALQQFIIQNVADIGEDMKNYNVDAHLYFNFNKDPIRAKIKELEDRNAEKTEVWLYYLMINYGKAMADKLVDYTAHRDALMDFIENLDFDS